MPDGALLAGNNYTYTVKVRNKVLEVSEATIAKSVSYTHLAIDATVNLTLHILPDNLLLAGIFIAACFISLSIGTSEGTIVALTPVAVGLAEKTGIDLPYICLLYTSRCV